MKRSLIIFFIKDPEVRRGFFREFLKLVKWIIYWIVGVILCRLIMKTPLMDDWISPLAGILAVTIAWIISAFRTVRIAIEDEKSEQK